MRQVDNHLGRLRQERGLSAAQLAQMAGVSRQTVYAMEAGGYVPNTAVALRLARALDAPVEALFRLAQAPPADPATQTATLLPGSARLEPGQPVQLCRVDRREIATPPAPFPWYFPASDAIVVESKRDEARVQPFARDALREGARPRILAAGCDPGISVLARHVQAAGVDLVFAHRNSSQALALLEDGCIHLAGTHLHGPHLEDKTVAKKPFAVISFAIWEEGLLTARGNPKSIRGVEDLARADVSIVNREKGAGCRNLLDAHLKRLGIPARRVRGYDLTAAGHFPAAWQVQSGAADCCVATRGAARVFGLGFIPLISERYDLVVRRRHLDLPGVQAVFDTLSRASFRRELESLGGYDTAVSGQRRDGQ